MENTADVEYYTTYPKTPEKRAGNPNFRLRMRTPFQGNVTDVTFGHVTSVSHATCTTVLHFVLLL